MHRAAYTNNSRSYLTKFTVNNTSLSRYLLPLGQSLRILHSSSTAHCFINRLLLNQVSNTTHITCMSTLTLRKSSVFKNTSFSYGYHLLHKQNNIVPSTSAMVFAFYSKPPRNRAAAQQQRPWGPTTTTQSNQ